MIQNVEEIILGKSGVVDNIKVIVLLHALVNYFMTLKCIIARE